MNWQRLKSNLKYLSALANDAAQNAKEGYAAHQAATHILRAFAMDGVYPAIDHMREEVNAINPPVIVESPVR